MLPTIFDIETTAIKNWRTFEGLEKIHCLVLRRGNKVETYHGEEPIRKGLAVLAEQDLIAGHNALCFDIPAIQHLYPSWKPLGLVRDTKVMARLCFPDQKNYDYGIFKSLDAEVKKSLIGSHSLKAWGVRLGELKADFAESEEDWSVFTEEMLEYCVQDTLVTQRLYDHCVGKSSDQSLLIEHEFQRIIWKQECRGFSFDTKAAVVLWGELVERQSQVREELEKIIPPTVKTMKRPAYWYCDRGQFATKKEGIEAGCRSTELLPGPPETKEIPFNPGSRQQIAAYLQSRGWEPQEFTPGGDPKIDESALRSVDIEEAKPLITYLMIEKRIGQLAEGDQAWLKHEQDGVMYGSVNTIGTATSRCTHSRPNIAQVPSCRAPYGKQCRQLFRARPGMVLCGVDVSGLELRCLAHYLHKWDGGRYVDEILNGDIHEANRDAAGLETRDQAKAFIYAFIYGGGPKTIGAIAGGDEKEGTQLMKRFLTAMPALKSLRDAISSTLKSRNWLHGLDGRRVPIRSKHSALNYLLQSAGSIIVKNATCIASSAIPRAGAIAFQVAHIHDEIQYECADEDHANLCGQTVVSCIQKAGYDFEFRCPLDGEYKVGATWADTH